MLPHLTLVLGGARSGKSEFAERLVEFMDCPRTFIATAQALDDEMRNRIDEHINRRGTGWRTIDAPLEVASAFGEMNDGEVALLDCATVWLSNRMLAEDECRESVDRLLSALERCRSSVVTVSNEVGQGIVPADPLARRFRDEQGRLNQKLASRCGLVVLVSAGLPLVLKGTLPEGFE